MNRIKFNDGTRLNINNISSTTSELTISVLDDERIGLEAILKDPDKTSVIQLLSVNEETQDEVVLKGYSGYTNLKFIKTEYDVVTNIDYETTDSTTESGFAEERHNVTTAMLSKLSHVESEIAAIKESQSLQDGAIEELAEVISEIAEG